MLLETGFVDIRQNIPVQEGAFYFVPHGQSERRHLAVAAVKCVPVTFARDRYKIARMWRVLMVEPRGNEKVDGECFDRLTNYGISQVERLCFGFFHLHGSQAALLKTGDNIAPPPSEITTHFVL